ncbi:MAG: cysteine--tRNA ligase [Candidatus Omnitrophota bacterium]
MAVHIYNSLTKRKEEFIPLKGRTVNMYTCGVTVYDVCHIGHARSLYVFDMIRRYLKYRGFKVNFVRNITDVDDKIINKANELNKKSEEVSQANIEAYYQDLKALHIDTADQEPQATRNIPEMIEHIQGLIDKGYAYAAGGDVYFSVRKFPEYGKLSGQSIEKMIDAVRIEKDLSKKDPLDFALWKKSKDNEPFWDSPWGRGRPGWHIECSVMSLKHLHCETLDIHAGGRDLIFPHHENEIAQSEALSQKPFAKYWIHHGLLTINGQKMAKSLGNFITVSDILKKYTPDELKLFFLSSHYASPVDFTEQKMEESRKALQKFDILFWKTAEVLKDQNIKSSSVVNFVEEAKNNFLAAMDDDFNTPQGLAALFDLINETNKLLSKDKKTASDIAAIDQAVSLVEELAKNIFGLFTAETEKILSEELEDILNDRKKSRQNKDFKRSDELRDVLKKKGVIVEDTKEGQVWRWA